MNKTLSLCLILVGICITGTSLYGIFKGGFDWVHYSVDTVSNSAAVFLVDSTTREELLKKYKDFEDTEKPVTILIVPGHEPYFGGAEYSGIKERDLNLELAEDLQSFLREDSHYKVLLARDERGWNDDLETYFGDNLKNISEWRANQQAEMAELVSEGKMNVLKNAPAHGIASSDVALRLYAINKWASDSKVDCVIHIHFNDYASRAGDGRYSGFSIYVPEKQYSNAKAGQSLGNFIFRRLSLYGSVSTFGQETGGVIEDQDLIAIGRFNTLDPASVLIEYAYISEPWIRNAVIRKQMLNEYAYQTALGINNFFGSTASSSVFFDTTLLPQTWSEEIKEKGVSPQVTSLQIALMRDGVYPPSGKTRSDCPLSGIFGQCTKSALISFQRNHKIEGEDGVLGKKTRAELNVLFSGNSR